ncbi:MAG: TonB-dependent receptor [Bacteroidota bacterium]
MQRTLLSSSRWLSASYIYLSLIFTLGLGLPQLPAQDLFQIVRGQIVDQTNQAPLSGALISLENTQDSPTAKSGSDGKFTLENVPVGRQNLLVKLAGYETYLLNALDVHSGKEIVLTISLAPRLYEGEEIVIDSRQARDVKNISTRTFTVEESQRFAATYYDPARLVASFPGVASVNDEANNIVVRGNSPNGLLWRLEGVDIVNPNHLTNAGTFSDRLTQNGGGTIILSAQMLGNSRFTSGAFGSLYGNALSGVFDMSLRSGNNEQFEFILQPSLIGLDLAAEGPLGQKGGASFLLNYRYSTVGFFGAVGIPLTPEDIRFQDLSFKLNFPTKKLGTFSVWGIGGLSSNNFQAPRVDSLISEQRDRFDINFYSNMGAVGANHSLLLGNKTHWKTSLAWSGIDSERTGDLLDENFEVNRVEEDFQKQRKLSLHSRIQHFFNTKFSLQSGLIFNQINYELQANRFPNRQSALASAVGNSYLLQPYVSGKFSPNRFLTLDVGAHLMYFGLNQQRSLEPRASLRLQPSPRHSLALAYGLHSQLQLWATYFSVGVLPNDQTYYPNENLGFTRAHHWVFNYTYAHDQFLKFKVEPYYQALFGVPVEADRSSAFSALNLLEGYVTSPLNNEGTGTNYGVELSAEKTLNQGYYFLLSSSLFESKYRGSDGILRDTRYNSNILVNTSAGREFERISKKKEHKIFGINFHLVYQGGFRSTPIDLAASQLASETIFIEDQAFSERLPAFFRTDLRFTFTRNRAKYTRVFSVDILNLTNRRNVAFQRFDWVSGEIVDKQSLGLFPLLSYRIEL